MPSSPVSDDARFLGEAIALARQGVGRVEPNPPVGCVVVQDGHVVGAGAHREFGGPHAEIDALAVAGPAARGATAYVTLEPCCHQGKTPPCTEALVAAGVARVVVGARDPNPQVDGQGIATLKAAGVAVEIGPLEQAARALIAPFEKLILTGRPWVIAKWAMTLDGKLATSAGSSQWISGPASRAAVHQLRGRVDAVVVGRQTAVADDPLLTARPPGPRTAARVVLDRQGRLSDESQLVNTVDQGPVVVVVGPEVKDAACQRLDRRGVEVLRLASTEPPKQLDELLSELGRRQWTNLLFEGGGQILGWLFDQHAVDEVHVFVAPKIAGGVDAPSPVQGRGVSLMSEAWRLDELSVQKLGDDIYLSGRTRRQDSPPVNEELV